MIFLNSKHKKLDNIYIKIGEQSKQSFYFNKNITSDINFFVELFQTNFILILWYMKHKNVKKKFIDYLIKKFVKDLESSVIESGGSETSLKKKIRTIIENFYGRLYSYSLEFDTLINEDKKSNLKKIIKKNFKYTIDVNLLENYLKQNVLYFKELKVDDFWRLEFFNKNGN